MKIKQLFLSAIITLSVAFGTHAQVKVGSNPTAITANTNLEVEATDGKKVKINKPDGKFYIETKPTAAKTDSVVMRFSDGEVRQMSINRLLGQLDLDGDGIVDGEDPDIDGDGILNTADNCPRQYCQTAPGCPASCAAAPTPSVTADCNTAGFNVGTYISGIALSGRTYTLTITNNSFSAATIPFSASDLVLSGTSGLTVGTPTGSPALVGGTATLAAGSSITVTYPISGTPTNCGVLTGVWTKLTLKCTKTINISPNVSCITGSWTTPITPSVSGGLINGTNYTGTYGIPYTGGNCTLSPETLTQSGLTLSYQVGALSASGNLVYTLSGTYQGISGDLVTFTTRDGCRIDVGILMSCKEIKLANPAATDGVYWIDPDATGSVQPMQVVCDMTNNGGGWTLILKSMNNDGTFAYSSGIWASGNPFNTTDLNITNSSNSNSLYSAYNNVIANQVWIDFVTSPDLTPYTIPSSLTPKQMATATGNTLVSTQAGGCFTAAPSSFFTPSNAYTIQTGVVQMGCNLQGRIRFGLATDNNPGTSFDGSLGIGALGIFAGAQTIQTNSGNLVENHGGGCANLNGTTGTTFLKALLWVK